jgi:D-tagatose-1,6-bisphosphate aldolase subunit GatZ/KbaZ
MNQKSNYLDWINQQQKKGNAVGITSICSAHHETLEACLIHVLKTGEMLLIESTSNQVNQYGGYTKMTPSQFVAYIYQMVDKFRLPRGRLLLGGDHLGPNVWKKEPAAVAMEKSLRLVRDYVLAGYQKIHLDTSMPCADDPHGKALDPEIAAQRTAQLSAAAEQAFEELGIPEKYLRYVIGTEVPLPGGILAEEESLQLSMPENVAETIELTRRAFFQQGLEDAWQRVCAVVVQPGVEYGDHLIYDYDRSKSASLVSLIEGFKGLLYEAHSTDYQIPAALKQLVEDHFAILKVGPALTFAFREALFALAAIESVLFRNLGNFSHSELIETIDRVMDAQPSNWQEYYSGKPREISVARHFSFSDRIRYYWPDQSIQQALRILIANLSSTNIPLSLLSQYMPAQFQRVRSGELRLTPLDLIRDHIMQVLDDYSFACSE